MLLGKKLYNGLEYLTKKPHSRHNCAINTSGGNHFYKMKSNNFRLWPINPKIRQLRLLMIMKMNYDNDKNPPPESPVIISHPKMPLNHRMMPLNH